MPPDLDIHVSSVDGTQMAAKITGAFKIAGAEFPFTAIAFGRIGGQNIGAQLSKDTEAALRAAGHDPEEVALGIQTELLRGNMTVPEGLKRESFADS